MCLVNLGSFSDENNQLWTDYNHKYLEGGTPLLDLHLPVEHDGGGDDDQVGAPHALLAGEVCEQGDGLDGLAQSHLVGEDPVEEALCRGFICKVC